MYIVGITEEDFIGNEGQEPLVNEQRAAQLRQTIMKAQGQEASAVLKNIYMFKRESASHEPIETYVPQKKAVATFFDVLWGLKGLN